MEVRLAFLCEGPQDERFLPGIIRRTAEKILQESPRPIDLAEIELIPKNGIGQVEIILNAAREAFGRDILIVHADADSENLDSVLSERIEPGFNLVSESEDQDLCKNLVAITPAYMIENWILADKKKLKENIGTEENDQNLELNFRLAQVENISNPKEKIDKAIRLAFGQQRRRLPLNRPDLYEPKGNEIDLEILEQLPSYQKFQKDLRNQLAELNFLR